MPLADLAFSFAGANASSYQHNGGICNTTLTTGTTCPINTRLVAGKLLATYQASARVIGTGLAAIDSTILSHRVLGSRL